MPTYSKELDIEVHVTVDGEPIREYIDGDAASDSDVITRYVEAIAGSEFEIAYTISGSHPTGKDMRVRCRVDGTIVRKPVHQFERGSWHKDCVMSGVRKRQGTAEMMRMFRFKTIAVGERSLIVEILDTSLLVCNRSKIWKCGRYHDNAWVDQVGVPVWHRKARWKASASWQAASSPGDIGKIIERRSEVIVH